MTVGQDNCVRLISRLRLIVTLWSGWPPLASMIAR